MSRPQFVMKVLICVAVCFAAAFPAGVRAQSAAAGAPVDFSRDVRPILSDRCFKCHGPDEAARQVELRLDRREDADYVLDGDSPADSELLRRITETDPDERMPPADSGLTLNAEEIDTLRRWIEQGAAYQPHWSYRPLGAVQTPDVTDVNWPRNDIDRFVLARLEQAGLSPSPEAGRERLIRRLSFDLTGLPPTLEEIDAFLADASADAYETLVDRLLGRPEYGERMAAEWLDVARYSDSYGYQVDRDRFVWPWRDWVIRAFNRNLPYDRFVTWQLAGDLLPGATDEHILATTFNRLHSQKVEGGSVPEEFRVEYVADRTHTFATAFLGLTLECARCHDHKFDPVTQREYYQLFAFFNNIDEAGLYSYFTPAIPTPTLLLAGESTQAKLADARRQISGAEAELLELRDARREAFSAWLNQRPSVPEIPGRIAHLSFEEEPGGGNRAVPGVTGKAVLLSGDDGIELKVGNFRRFEPFSVAFWMNTPEVKERAVIYHRSRAWTDAGSRGYELLLEDGKLSAALIHFWPGNALGVRTVDPVPTGEWLHVAVTYDGSSRADGLRIHVNGRPASCDTVRDQLTKQITGGGGDNITIGERFRDRGFTGGMIDEFHVYQREITALEIAHLHDGRSLADALAAPAESLTFHERSALADYYLATLDESYQAKLDELAKLRQTLADTIDPVQEIMVMRERELPRATYLLRRGAYDAPTERMHAGTPSVLPEFPADAPRDRLGLAQWLTGPAHPLLARVTVNRYWQMCFGAGLVRTPEDFGSQGQPPSHPELLDWLAGRFVQSGWDVRWLLKMMVTSATYRQSSVRPPGSGPAADSSLLARTPSFRLPAEMIRDNALAASGLLVRRIGGPPVRPYEVENSFKPVDRDRGDGLYRRSLYTYQKRTAPAPVMDSLDAAKREVCTVRRERTSSPLQALVLLNDPQMVEAARVLAARCLADCGADVDAAIVDIFRLLVSRRPLSAELDVLRRLFDEQLAVFQQHPERALELLSTGDAPRDERIAPEIVAAGCVTASAIMNLDESVTKR